MIALQNLVGILYETQFKPAVLGDRIAAATYHPLLGPYARANAERVLRLKNATWAQLKNYTETLGSVARKPIPIRIKQVPVYNFGDEGDYQKALEAHANARLAALDARDRTYHADEYYQKVREKAGALKDTPGYCECVFESPSFSSLERLQLPASVERALGGVVYLISPTHTSYIHYHVTRKFTSAAAMQRADQHEDSDDDIREPQERFYRSVILYHPDPYLPCYVKWQKYGGVKNGREHLEDLTRELLATS